jgi:hypothetical protein
VIVPCTVTTNITAEEPAALTVCPPRLSMWRASRTISRGYKAFTNGKLAESGTIFKSTLQSAMVARVDSKGELDEILEQMSVCREYTTAVLLG